MCLLLFTISSSQVVRTDDRYEWRSASRKLSDWMLRTSSFECHGEQINSQFASRSIMLTHIKKYDGIERLPFVPKTRCCFFRMKCQMERFNSVKIFRNRRNAFEGVPLFLFQLKLHHMQNLTRAILSSTVDDFVNLGTSRPSLPSSTGSCRFWQMVQHRILTR